MFIDIRLRICATGGGENMKYVHSCSFDYDPTTGTPRQRLQKKFNFLYWSIKVIRDLEKSTDDE